MAAKLGDTRDEYYELFNIYWPIGVAVWLIIAALTAYIVIRFRSRKRELPEGKDTHKAEEVYAGFVGLIAAALLYFTFNTMSDLAFTPESEGDPGKEVEGAELVKVTAARWRWRFDYPKYGVSQTGTNERPATLVVPSDTPVRFEQTSLDVIHSFWIVERRFKVDAFPARTTTFTLRFPDEGFQRQGGECNQYCGLLHTDMVFHVNVLPKDEFRRWARDKQREEEPS